MDEKGTKISEEQERQQREEAQREQEGNDNQAERERNKTEKNSRKAAACEQQKSLLFSCCSFTSILSGIEKASSSRCWNTWSYST